MEVGLACVFSDIAEDRLQVEGMARRLNAIQDATREAIDSAPFALRARVAPWAGRAIASDPATGTRLILLGRAWRAHQEADAATLLQRFLQEGPATVGGLGGSFAIVVWQPSEKTLLLITDRLGTKKLYVWQSAETILVATELAAILGHPRVPRVIDEAAVEQFLVTSHLVDTSTLVRDVKVLPPGTIVRIDPAGLSRRTYWSPRIVRAEDDGLDAWADRLAEVLSPAVRARCSNGPLLLPLSGGLDSRSIAAFVPPHLASTALSASFGHPHCLDVRYGRRVARALGARFRFMPLPEAFFRLYLGPVQALCDGEVSIEALPMYRLMEMGRPGQTMLMGFLGDALSGGHLLGLDPAARSAADLDTVWRRKYQGKGFSEPLLEQVLLPERYRAVTGGTRAIMQDALEKAEAETLDEKALIAELHHRQSRYIAYFGRLLSSRYRVENPFLDLDVLDTFLALPLAHRQGQRAYRRMLVRHAPRLAAVPEMKTHRPVRDVAFGDTPSRAATANPAAAPTGPLQWRLNKARRTLGAWVATASGGWIGPHNRDYYVHHDESIRRVDPDWFRTRLLDDAGAADWFHLHALEKLFEEHLSRKQDHSTRINNVVAFLAWRATAGF